MTHQQQPSYPGDMFMIIIDSYKLWPWLGKVHMSYDPMEHGKPYVDVEKGDMLTVLFIVRSHCNEIVLLHSRTRSLVMCTPGEITNEFLMKRMNP